MITGNQIGGFVILLVIIVIICKRAKITVKFNDIK